jgi:hypothetical protein
MINNMFKFLNDNFEKTDAKKFRIYSPFASLFADVILLIYINQNMLPRMLSKDKLYRSMSLINPQIKYLSSAEFDNIVQILTSTMSFTFLLFLGFNTVMYILAARKVKIGTKFLYGYTLSAALLSVLELVGTLTTSYPFSWATFFTFFIYFYIYSGLKYFKKK